MFQLTTTLHTVSAIYLILVLPNSFAILAATGQLNNAQVDIIRKPVTKTVSQKKPKLQLARNFRNNIKIKNYWVSEKLDGVRGYWNGQQLLTRSGNILSPPRWFTKNWPDTAMGGEIWSARGEFEQISACIRAKTSSGQCWKKLKLMLFDLPNQDISFTDRITTMKKIVTASHSPHLRMIRQVKIDSTQRLYSLLDNIVDNNGEGLMLHLESAYYQSGRSKNVLKLKKHYDAEAKVIAHMPGKGKYIGLLGAIKVQTPEGLIFKIGSGFSDKERQNPPKIGSLISYKYIGKTQRGVPRFASFLRIKKQH
jgi:DNA ligase-1